MKRYCLLQNTLCEGPVPAERDNDGQIVYYDSREAAQRSIDEDRLDRAYLFIEGEMSLWDAVASEEHVAEVDDFKRFEVFHKAEKSVSDSSRLWGGRTKP